MKALVVALLFGLAAGAAGAAGDDVAQRWALDSATAMRGPLEGSWRLATSQGRALYAFELTDPGGHPDAHAAQPQTPAVEGAWRDLRRPGDRLASGVFDSVADDGKNLTLRFGQGSGGAPVTVALHRAAHGDWRGRLTSGARVIQVLMRRASP